MAVDWIDGALRSLNPSLLDHPPPCEEVTGSDLCYVDIQCNELPHGQRCVIGSWYLSSQRHILEFVLVTFVCLLTFQILTPPSRCTKVVKKNHHHQTLSLQPPTWLTFHSILCTSITVAYKTMGYSGKILFMAMPCNTIWILYSLICLGLQFGIMSEYAAHVLLQISASYMSLVALALATPDLGDLVQPFEVYWFFLSHVMLFFMPLYYIFSGRISTLGTVVSFMKWWWLSCTFFSLYYVTIITPVSIVSGFNLNYMLSPPPLPVDFVTGEDFRIISMVFVFSVFFGMRVFITFLECAIRWVFGGSTVSRTSDTFKKEN
uniref:Uncharacterized protein n=1 Tax=Leptocylindrus danicus TaxID=163516 RepID=A0A7S2K6P0_9STRA|mmetsp:Transcript_18796/g.27882  ORF Transcript_18796/g.27882 Transcript_18796/m.27882 type:complete len:319 (+) Transcript_18796:31-987(+)|eukprot:CAMPEP_0116034760 /NCGR_PEP_ID=MMETSP0321-20121206/19849_1 /TAXON_ID=163516 /ORGANISM="Leptocylindrus danicus var. danicus, Strain B650" /LENGTH=318 /DNA_ID=CAMNT_0003511233 /DNA_START=18 /DNA_END=974 /DNA_ORIENTATION=-